MQNIIGQELTGEDWIDVARRLYDAMCRNTRIGSSRCVIHKAASWPAAPALRQSSPL